jgi:hypothetical protein
MLPTDDFLRRLPQCLAPVERLRLETLVFAHDLMEIALGRLYTVGIGFDENNDAQRFAMFSDAWTIVDQVHVVRQVLLSLTGDDRKSDTQAVIGDFAVAHTMRNKMDHLNQNLLNRAKADGRTNALFGMLTFFRPFADRWEQGLQDGEVRGDLFFVSAGSKPRDMVGGVAFHDLDIHLPICSFKLEAFDLSLLIERAVLQLRPLLKRMSDEIKSNVEAKVDELAARSGCTREELMRPVSGHIVIRMDFGFHVEQPGAPLDRCLPRMVQNS